MAAEILNLPLPPHSVEAEQAVLGALLLDGQKAWPLVAPILQSTDFYRPDHRLIFEAIAELGGADAVTLYAHLERAKKSEQAGGLAYLSRLARETSTGANAEHYARIVRERAQLRGLAEMGRRLEAGAVEWGTSAEELAADLERQLSELRGRARSGAGLTGADELARQLVDDLERRREGECGLPTGLADFDLLTGGLEPGELTIIAGRPGTGKTSLLVTVADHISREKSVAVFSAEMPALQLARRCTALSGGISQTKLRHPKRLGNDDWVRISEGVSHFGARKLWIDDRQLPPMEHIRAECIGHKARHGLALVLIDYCQLIAGHGANRYEQLREVAYGSKALAKELSCPVVMLAQINRGVESREDRRPRLSDLRDSGSIEEAADIVGLLYCEGYYNQDFDMPNILECAIEKHRNGERGQCLWHFAGEFSRMVALEDSARASYRFAIRNQKRKGHANDL
jgi:replicative DNA helicase